jgi:hypothetical protein
MQPLLDQHFPFWHYMCDKAIRAMVDQVKRCYNNASFANFYPFGLNTLSYSCDRQLEVDVLIFGSRVKLMLLFVHARGTRELY